MKSKRVFNEMPTENIPLLQEIAFVKNRELIVKYLSEKKDEEDRLYKELEVSFHLIIIIGFFLYHFADIITKKHIIS